MSSSLHRRSLQDVDALGLFHHGRGVGRHLTRQSSSTDDSRRRSSANLHNASSVTHLAGSLTGRPEFLFKKYHFIHLFYGKLRTKLRLGERSQEGRLKAPMVKWVGRGSIPSSSSSVLRPRISSLQPMGPVEPTLIFPDQPLWPCWSLSNLEKAAYLSLYENRLVWNLFVKIVHYLLVVSEARVVLRCGFRLSCTSWSSRYPRLWLKSKELFL